MSHPTQQERAEFKLSPRLFKALNPIVETLALYHQYEIKGLENIPLKGRLLLVVSHSLATYDILLLGHQIYLHTQRLPRSLGDRMLFKTPLLNKLVAACGTEEGSPENAHALLNAEEIVTVAPGGMREALRSSDKKYTADWQNRRGFARLAIETQTPIVLAACPAADDIYSVYENPLTNYIYEKFRAPFPFARGIGLTPLPRPVKLVHTLSKPITPPKASSAKQEEQVKDFHQRLSDQMQRMLQTI